MKLTTLLLTAAFLDVSARGLSQNVTVNADHASLETVFRSIERQTAFTFFFQPDLLNTGTPVTIHLSNQPLKKVLDSCFAGQPFTWSMEGRIITLEARPSPHPQPVQLPAPEEMDPPGSVRIYVADSTGAALEGASVVVKRTRAITLTNFRGVATLNGTQPGDVLTISFVGYQNKEVTIKGNEQILSFVLHVGNNSLDEMQVIAYGTISKRLNTGDVSTVKAAEIEKQPVTDLFAALEGQVPGLQIESGGGLPGMQYNLTLRGTNTINSNNMPLIIVDGVPYNNSNIGSLNLSSQSIIMGIINPHDIASVDVLKDADATSIYGSQGANGVILITTKSGKQGPTTFNASVNRGENGITHLAPYMNTAQYLQMRKEAFANDGITPNTSNAPDLVTWSQTAFTDFKRLMLQRAGIYTDAQLGVSGGSGGTGFRVNLGYNRATPPVPGNFYTQRGTLSSDFNNVSANGRFSFDLKSLISLMKYVTPTYDPSTFLALPPNIPALRNPDGTLNWIAGIQNPYAQLLTTNGTSMKNINTAYSMKYLLLPGLSLTSTGSFSYNTSDYSFIEPAASFNPAYGVTSGVATQDLTDFTGIDLSLQAQYIHRLFSGTVTALIGGRYTQASTTSQATTGSGFINDLTLNDFGAASSVTVQQTDSKTLYGETVARINYNLGDEYLLDFTGNRDGSSTFGPSHRFGNFGSAAAAWIFTRESFVQRALPFLSFGKLRTSFGTTGQNTQPYSYLDLYQTNNLSNGYYQGVPNLEPLTLYNPDLHWATARKWNVGLDLGFVQDRVHLGGAWFRNRSFGEIMGMPLAPTTGFSSVNVNWSALVQNTGMEFNASSVNIKSKKFTWSTSFNLGWYRNKLVSYPGLATSSYANSLIIGKSISIRRLLKYAGVDTATGVYRFYNASGHILTGYYNYPGDLTARLDLTPRYTGAIENTFRYDNLSLSFLLVYTKKTAGYRMGGGGDLPPGFMDNQPSSVLKDHWQKPGDKAAVQGYTETYGTAFNAFSDATESTLYYTNASYARLKNVNISYELSRSWMQRAHLKGGRISFRAENLFTITKYPGLDPENGSATVPPIKTATASLGIDF